MGAWDRILMLLGRSPGQPPSATDEQSAIWARLGRVETRLKVLTDAEAERARGAIRRRRGEAYRG